MLSPELCHSMGLRPGARLRAEVDGNTLWLHRPLSHLAKVYIEPTDVCNLDCVTYFRNTWQSPHSFVAYPKRPSLPCWSV